MSRPERQDVDHTSEMNRLQRVISYHYRDEELLRGALTHSSYANERGRDIKSNERLEFLGDAVLSIVVSDYIYRENEDIPEGELTKLRASLVCERSLCEFAGKIGLGDALLLGRGEELTGGRERPSILADAFEALLASIYLDGGIEAAKRFVLSFVIPQLDKEHIGVFKDYKTMLQEVIQQNREESISYRLAGESGPDHDKRFEVEVRLNSNVIGKGTGRSKKEAEQQAAKEALALMGRTDL